FDDCAARRHLPFLRLPAQTPLQHHDIHLALLALQLVLGEVPLTLRRGSDRIWPASLSSTAPARTSCASGPVLDRLSSTFDRGGPGPFAHIRARARSAASANCESWAAVQLNSSRA